MFAPELLKVKLKDKALELGFDDLRVCSASDFGEEESVRLQKWLDDGMFDRMQYLQRAKSAKISPQKYLQGAVSAICVCASFWRNSPERRIALYAQGKDYHDVIKPKLLDIASVLETEGYLARVSVDASPLWEKLLCARAGLGWIGKNTLLTRAENGSWNFLGVILTTALLPFDSPIENRCGACVQCVKACPTCAITDNGVDARKCISNLTIERKELNEAETKLIGEKIFGCDECLRACPFGKNSADAKIADFTSNIILSENPSMQEIFDIAQGTPMERKFKKIK